MRKSALLWILAVVGAMCHLASFLLLFGPMLVSKTALGEEIAFHGSWMIFGWSQELELSSGTYAFAFSMNVPLLAMTMMMGLAGLSSLIGARSVWNKVFSLILSIASLVIMAMWISLVLDTSSLVNGGLYYGAAYYFSWILCCFGTVLDLVSIGFLLHKKKPALNA